MPDESSFQPPDEELKQRGERFAERASQLLEKIKEVEAGVTHDALASLSYFLQSQACYAELNRREAIRRADRDRKHNEKIEKRDFWMEVGVMALIGLEIALSIYYGQRGLREGKEQGAILEQMNKNTKDTAAQIQRAADAMTQTLQVLQADRADRAKKPRPALYIGNIPIDKATVRPTLPATVPNGPSQSMARLDLLLKNEGDAPLSSSEIHALVPEGINIYLSPLPSVPEYEEPSKPGTRTMSYAVPLTPIRKSLRIDCQILVPNGHAPFKVAFTITTPQLQAVMPLGSLTVLPSKP